VVASATEEGLARCRGISEHELKLVTSRPVRVGARLFVEIATRFGDLSLIGRVTSCAAGKVGPPYQMALALEIVPPNDRQVLDRLAEHLTTSVRDG